MGRHEAVCNLTGTGGNRTGRVLKKQKQKNQPERTRTAEWRG